MEMKRRKQLADENRRLIQLLADLTSDREMLVDLTVVDTVSRYSPVVDPQRP